MRKRTLKVLTAIHDMCNAKPAKDCYVCMFWHSGKCALDRNPPEWDINELKAIYKEDKKHEHTL